MFINQQKNAVITSLLNECSLNFNSALIYVEKEPPSCGWGVEGVGVGLSNKAV